MEAANREETEAELAAVPLLLGIIFADLQPSGPVPYSAYLQEFNRLVRPRLTRIYGKAYEHNGWIPRDRWLDESEKQAIIQYHFDHPLEEYRHEACPHSSNGLPDRPPAVLSESCLLSDAPSRFLRPTVK